MNKQICQDGNLWLSGWVGGKVASGGVILSKICGLVYISSFGSTRFQYSRKNKSNAEKEISSSCPFSWKMSAALVLILVVMFKNSYIILAYCEKDKMNV